MVVVVDPVNPRVNCCARRSSRRSSHSHESWNGAPVVRSVVVEAMEGEVVVGHSCCVMIINTHPGYYVMYY